MKTHISLLASADVCGVSAEKQRIAIAEACGWKFRKSACNHWLSPDGNAAIEPPDYCNDLNAMHEAEGILLNENQQRRYIETLVTLLRSEVPEDTGWAEWFRTVYATAAQRAEAFLRTIGKWEEE